MLPAEVTAVLYENDRCSFVSSVFGSAGVDGYLPASSQISSNHLPREVSARRVIRGKAINEIPKIENTVLAVPVIKRKKKHILIYCSLILPPALITIMDLLVFFYFRD